MPDIKTYEDIEAVIRAFYSRLLPDPIVGFFFTDIARIDLPAHIPKITRFWEFQLFGVRNYRGNVYEVHRALHMQAALTPDHFHRWIFLLRQSVDELFAGPHAELMKTRAAMIAEKMAMALASNASQADLLPGVHIAEPKEIPE